MLTEFSLKKECQDFRPFWFYFHGQLSQGSLPGESPNVSTQEYTVSPVETVEKNIPVIRVLPPRQE